MFYGFCRIHRYFCNAVLGQVLILVMGPGCTQAAQSRLIQKLSIPVKPGAMARAVPAFLLRIPLQAAAHMGADRRLFQAACTAKGRPKGSPAWCLQGSLPVLSSALRPSFSAASYSCSSALSSVSVYRYELQGVKLQSILC